MDDIFRDDDGLPLFRADIDKKNKALEAERKLNASNCQSIYKKVFCDSPEGREVLIRMMYDCEVFAVPFSDSAGSYRHNGKRKIGLDIMNIIGHEDWIKAMAKGRIEAMSRGKKVSIN